MTIRANIVSGYLNDAIKRGETLDNAGRIAAFKCNEDGGEFKYEGFEDFGGGHIVFMFNNPQLVVSVDMDRATTVVLKKRN